MCGILGWFDYSGQGQCDENEFRQALSLMAHRGPDDWGLYRQDGVLLGHRRLIIIDLTSAGRQPVSSRDQRVWITYNGELYNSKDLRVELKKRDTGLSLRQTPRCS